ncbi:hypothetical protein ES702_07373 [subsurface metagenome]
MARKRKRKKAKIKWGKVGAPGSAKRRAWMRRMRAARKGKVLKRDVSGNHAVKKRRKKKRKVKRKVKRRKTTTRRRFP